MKTKRTIFIAAIFVLLSQAVQAQDNMDVSYTGEARRGQFLLSAGIGFIDGVGGIVNVEYGLVGNKKAGVLTAGLFGSIMWDDWTMNIYPEAVDRKHYSAGFRMAYRYDLICRLEMYVALWTGMIYMEDYAVGGSLPYSYYDPTAGTTVTSKPSYGKYPHNTLMWQGGGYLGFRYHFCNVAGLYVEGGYGLPVINGGVTFSF
jgi:hypothetical protein